MSVGQSVGDVCRVYVCSLIVTVISFSCVSKSCFDIAIPVILLSSKKRIGLEFPTAYYGYCMAVSVNVEVHINKDRFFINIGHNFCIFLF